MYFVYVSIYILIFTDRNYDMIAQDGFQHTNATGDEDETMHDAWQGIQGALLSAAATRSDGFPVEVIIGGNKRIFR